MRVRDVEIALVLAREMKAAAEREVDASLRLQQLKEVFGAERLDRAERARIQTALQMAGLEPQPSLLEVDPDEPIRFTLAPGSDAPAAAPAQADAGSGPPAQQEKPEFPTVGEFFRRRFKARRERAADDQVTTAEELAAGTPPPAEQGPPPAEETVVRRALPEPEPEPEIERELDPDLEAEQEIEPGPEALDEEEEVDPSEETLSPNGHVEAGTNGHAHLDFDDVLPPHETATPADFGASAETVDFDDPRVEELAAGGSPPDETALYETEPEPDAGLHEEPLPPAPFTPPPAAAAPEPAEPIAQPAPVRPAVLFAATAVPVVVASFAGWAFGLAFVALGLAAVGLLRHAGMGTLLRAGAAVTVASLAVSFLLAGAGDDEASDEPPAAEQRQEPAEPAPPPAEEPKPEEPAADREPKRDRTKRDKPKREERQPKADAPDDDTEGLIRVPPPQQQPQGTAPSEPGTQAAPEGTTTP